MNTIAHLLEQYGLNSLEKQEKLLLTVGEHSPDIDFEHGLIRFDAVEFSFQVLGTESDNTLTWLWAWAEGQTEIEDDLLRASLQMREWGEQKGIKEFSMPTVDLNKADGHVISLISSAVCEAACYFHDAYEGGGLFLLLFGAKIDQAPSFTIKSLSRQYEFLISLHELNHRNALVSYFHAKGISFRQEKSKITGALESGETLHAEFDDAGNIKSINGSEIGS